MSAFITKQPNGLYCRFSTVVDCPTDWNMTADDYIEMCKQRAEEDARRLLESNLPPFEFVKNYFYPNNMTEEEFDAFLNDVGDTSVTSKEGDVENA
jgi:hypothetical protein